MKTLFRLLGGALIIYLGFMAVISLQALFDRGDLKQASKFLYDYKPDGKKTLNVLMADALGEKPDDVYCESQIVSRSEGTLLLRCYPDASAAKINQKSAYEWLVNLISYKLTPNNAAATSLLKGIP